MARLRAEMVRAIELASLVGAARVDAVLGLAAIHGRFGENDLASIRDHLARSVAAGGPPRWPT